MKRLKKIQILKYLQKTIEKYNLKINDEEFNNFIKVLFQ